MGLSKLFPEFSGICPLIFIYPQALEKNIEKAMRTCIIFFDFDNVTKVNRIGKLPRQHDIERVFEASIYNLLDALLSIERFDEVTFRLYSGWHDREAEEYTDLYFMVSAALRNIPRVYKKTRLFLKIIVAPAGIPTAEILHTKRATMGIGNYKVILPHACADAENCSLKLIEKWIRKGCPHLNCQIKNNDAFQSIGQKTVDTLMVSDAMYFALQDRCTAMVIASNDDDMVPGLLYSAQTNKKVWWFRTKIMSVYDLLVEAHSVEIINYR